jgi:hypothetical protein
MGNGKRGVGARSGAFQIFMSKVRDAIVRFDPSLCEIGMRALTGGDMEMHHASA